MNDDDYPPYTVFETDKEKKDRLKESIAWYLKWFSSIVIVIAMSMRATAEVQYQIYDLWISTFGVFGWLGVSLLWKDRALIMLNAVGLLILLSGILKSFI